MKQMDTMIRFNGNTEEAFNFYKSVFGGDFDAVMRWKDMPAEVGGNELGEITEADKNKIMHISLPIGKSNVLMGNDILESFGHRYTPGDNFSISISAESKEEADKLFDALSDGGHKIMPMADAFWGSYFGMLTDKFGIEWMISFS